MVRAFVSPFLLVVLFSSIKKNQKIKAAAIAPRAQPRPTHKLQAAK
jgi:hypothetical protein